MELDVALVLGIVVMFVTIVGLKAFKNYNSVETSKLKMNSEVEAVRLTAISTIKDLTRSNNNYIYKIRKMRENYEIDYDDIALDETQDDEFKLSEIAQGIYPKLPESLAKLIDKEEFQNAIVKTVEKKPEILNMFLDKFIGKGSDQGSNSNSAPALLEKYL